MKQWIAVAGVLAALGCGACSERHDTPRQSAAGTPSAAMHAAGPIAAITFDNGVADRVGALELRVDGVTTSPDGRFGDCGVFANGSTLAYPNLPITPGGTWALWIRPAEPRTGAEARVMDANAFTIGFEGGHLFCLYYDDSVRSLRTEYPAGAGDWTHVAMTWDATAMKLYVNGVMQAQRIVTGGPAVPKRKLFVGARWTGSGMAFTGALDEIGVFDHALSQEALNRLVTQGLAFD